MNRALAFLFCLLASLNALAAQYTFIRQVPTAPILTMSVTGTGTVTSSPAGISCTSAGGAGCSASFSNGASITLTATPNPSNASATVHGTGTELTDWGGSACDGQSVAGTCAFTFSGAMTAAAEFHWKDSDIWWVSPTSGSDTLNNGRSFLTPYATIRKAITQMASGDTTYLADDLYTGGNTQCIGCFNGTFNPSDVPNGTSRKYTRFLGNTIGGATIDGQYQRNPVYLFMRSYVEVGRIRALRSSGAIISSDGDSGATGAALTVTYSGGSLQSVTSTGGTNYSTGSNNHAAVFGVTCDTYPEVTFTQSGGVPVSPLTVVYGGTNCVEQTGSGASLDLKSNNIYFHDNGAAYSAYTGTNAVGIYCNSCANSVLEDNWVWGYGSRYSVNTFSGVWNVMRRNIVRYDGANNGGQNNPNAGIVIYSEDYTIAENNVVVDFASLTGDSSDNNGLYMTSSSPLSTYPYGMGTGSFYGNVVTRLSGAGPGVGGLSIDNNKAMSSTPAGGVQSLVTIKDNVIGGNGSTTRDYSLYMGGDGLADTHGAHHSFVVDHNTLYDKYNVGFSVLMRVLDVGWISKTLTNNIFVSPGYPTVNCVRLDTSMTVVSNNIWNDCSNAEFGILPGSPIHANPYNQALKYLERCETSAPCKAAGTGATDIGATVVKRYANGVLTGTNLWPLPNETIARVDMCGGPDDGSSSSQNAGALVPGNTYYVSTPGNTSWTSIGAAANTAGTKFVATGAGSGTGVAQPAVFTRGHNQTGWCVGTTPLIDYVWQQLGSPTPPEITQ